MMPVEQRLTAFIASWYCLAMLCYLSDVLMNIVMVLLVGVFIAFMRSFVWMAGGLP